MEDFVCGEDYWPLIPINRIYEAQCVSFNSTFIGKARKLFLHFEIIGPDKYSGERIFMAFNMPYDGKIKQGSKFYKTWVKVNDYRKPSRNAKMSPRLFKNKICQIKVRTVKPKDNSKEMPRDFWYSVVDSIEEVIAG